MTESEKVSALIADIYDTTLDPARWTDVLEKINDFVGGAAAALVAHDTTSARGRFYYSWGTDAEFSRLYFEKYVRLNPGIVPCSLYVEAGEVFCMSTLVPYDEFLKTQIYREWFEPQGIGDFSAILIEKSATSLASLNVVHRLHDSPVAEEPRRRLRLLVPHVCRAVAISKIIDLHRSEADMLSDVTDALSTSVFLVRDDGTISYANACGREMLAQADLLRDHMGRLTAADPVAQRALADAFASAGAGDAKLGRRGIAIPFSAQGGERHLAHVMSLVSGARRRTGNRYAAVAAVFVHKATLHRPTVVEAIAEYYRLTAAELRVLFAVIEVGKVAQVAAVLGISQPTVRTHLQRVFRKTGTKGQIDLVKLVAGFMSPTA